MRLFAHLLASAALVGLSTLAWGTGQGTTAAQLCLIPGAAIAGFMLFNFPFGLNRRLRCFMGDAGSTFIGVVIGWLCAAISQIPLHDGLAHPSYALWDAQGEGAGVDWGGEVGRARRGGVKLLVPAHRIRPAGAVFCRKCR